MCDTFVKYISNRLFFGKNSDRSPNEPNLTQWFPAHRHDRSEKIHCTYLDVDALGDAKAMILIKPSWIWGAEMGINDQGVMIGNEAVFTRSADKKTPRLLGMDLLRLALELANTAKEGMDVILQYLGKYGQGGNCGFDKAFYYDNSFLISDRQESYILETAGKDWVAKRIVDFGNISNRLTLEKDYTLSSFSKTTAFASSRTEPIFSFFSQARRRQACVHDSLPTAETVSDFLAIMQSHQTIGLRQLYRKGSISSVCMHKSLLGDHTTASFLVDRNDTHQTIWISGSSSPCLGLYLPVVFGLVAPPVFENPQDSLQFWLDREYLHRAIYSDLIDLKTYQLNRDALQSEFIQQEHFLREAHADTLAFAEFSRDCYQKEQAFVAGYQNTIDIIKTDPSRLVRPWSILTRALGNHPFARNLKERQ
jgi:hypothetical protein